MGRVFVLLNTLLVFLAPCVYAQGLPPAERALIIAVRSSRPPTGPGAYELTLTSGAKIKVPSRDVHEPATALVRSEVAKQATPPVDPASVFVLLSQSVGPSTASQLTVTLLSGATVRVAAGDIRDDRLTFLGTALAEGAARERMEQIEKVRSIVAQYLRAISAKIGEKWERNQGVAGRVKMKFVVHRDGRITNIAVDESGGEVLDLAAVRALMMTRQVQPLPPEFPEKMLPVQLVFDYYK